MAKFGSPEFDIMKRKLNSGHQFHQYQRNEQSQLILIELTEHKRKITTYDVGNSCTGLEQVKHLERLNRPMGSQHSPLDNWIPKWQYIYKTTLKKKKPAQIRFHSKRPHTIAKMNDNMNIDSIQ